jgi:uncharacterized protein YbcV (DUF1398 family)
MRKLAEVKQRLIFDRYNQYWATEGNSTIWSNEAHFELKSHKNQLSIHRPKSENNEPFDFVSCVKESG